MTARTHDAFAFASLVTAAVIFPPQSINLLTLSAALVGNIVGALIPDMDQAGNRLWDLLPLGNQVGKIFRRIFYKHRTITHSLLGVFFIYKFLEWFLPKMLNELYIDPHIVFGSMMVGYISHLVADSFTKEGLPLFFPFNFEIGIPPFKFLRITTGKWVESYVVLPAIGTYLIWVIYKFQNEIVTILNSVHRLG